MDPVEQGLKDKLAQELLSPLEVQEGLTACFVLTNRRFMERRVGEERPLVEIDAVTRDLVNQVYDEVGINPGRPTLTELRKAWRILDGQLGFEADRALFTHHHQLIQRLFDLAA